MIVPHQQLRPETLHALIEEFVTRDGAVQGHRDTPIAQQIAAVRRQLAEGKAVIVFDEAAESCSIVPADAIPPGGASAELTYPAGGED